MGIVTALEPTAEQAHDSADRRMACLFDRHEGDLYRFARRLSGTREDACDLVQETFVRVLRARTRVPDGYDGERAWLFRTLVNVCRDRHRRASVRERFYRAFITTPAHPDPEPSFVARLSVEQALHRLDARRRAIVVLHEIDGESVDSVADLLGIAPATVRWHLSRARRELCKWLG